MPPAAKEDARAELVTAATAALRDRFGEALPGPTRSRWRWWPWAGDADHRDHLVHGQRAGGQWLDARAAFGVVDQWRAALKEANAGSVHREQVRLDGEELRAIYARREGAAARLVEEELNWRIEEDA